MSKQYDIASLNTFLTEVTKRDLYPKLVEQLLKDVHRAGVNWDIPIAIKPQALVVALHDLVSYLLKDNFNSYLNLLYAIDISESKLKDFNSEDINDIASFTTFLILKREWKKVEYRHLK